MQHANTAAEDYAAMHEAELVARARANERGAFRAIMQRGNQRLFRIARGVVRDEAEAEDIVQETYVRAFTNLSAFRGEASIFTWLTRIALNEAHGRLRKRRNNVELDEVETMQKLGGHVIAFPGVDAVSSPESDAERMQVRRLIESSIDELPVDFRTVFIMRDVEELSVAEAAAVLGIREETVKTRLHRARRLLRAALSDRLAAQTSDIFTFLGARCERITEQVLASMKFDGAVL